MAEQLKEFKELVVFVAVLGNGIGEALDNGKLEISDILKLLPALRLSKDAIDGLNEIPAELMEADEEMIANLRQQFIDDFDIPQDEVEATVERAWNAAFYLLDLVRSFLGK